jgi:competence ComEA-like helix-hairpin-helix protein
MSQDDEPLYVSKRNRRGVVALIVISIALIFFPRVAQLFNDEVILAVSTEDVQAFEKAKKNFKYKKRSNNNNYEKKKKRFSAPPQKFNPNDYTAEDWMNLGLSEKQVAVLLKFTKNGIRSNEDLKRIFVISDELFALIKDSTYYPERPKAEYTPKIIEEKKVKKLEINSATVEELEALKGIGPFFAKQIIKYRDRLGGFSSKEQILEVWKMTIETYDNLTPQIEIDKTKIKRLNINDITVEELKNHPYLNWSQANSIIKMRAQRTKFNNINEIQESKLIDAETFEKLIPYLSL